MRNAECGMVEFEIAAKFRIPHSALITHHSRFRVSVESKLLLDCLHHPLQIALLDYQWRQQAQDGGSGR